MTQLKEVAFAKLSTAEIALVEPQAKEKQYTDGDAIFRAGYSFGFRHTETRDASQQ